jgi:hypothetical protein
VVKKVAVIKWLIRNERWLSVALSAAVATFLGAYVAFYTASADSNSAHHRMTPFTKIAHLGVVNIFVLLGILCLLGQILLTVGSGRQGTRDAQSEAERLCQALLEAIVRILGVRRRQTYRALVTIADKELTVRRTVCGANIRVDPEVGVPVPVAFGIAGEAFEKRSVQVGNIDDTIRGKASDGSVIPGIWSEVRSVLAFPMLSADGQAFGTVNFDSNRYLETSGLGDRSTQDALAQVAQLVTYLMRSYGPDGNARLPH